MDRKIKTFSQGNKQKVGIVQAFVSDVPLIVLDEPTLGLDPLVQQEVLNFVREAQQQSKNRLLFIPYPLRSAKNSPTGWGSSEKAS